MPYDSLVMAASSSEFQHKLLGSRVMKIYQPDKFSITMRFHTAAIYKHTFLLIL